MTAEQFCYWLQGFLELGGEDVQRMDEKRVQIIRDHLKLVFTKVTPDRNTRSASQILQEEIERVRITQPGVRCSDGTRIC